jgi:hypothetical protein
MQYQEWLDENWQKDNMFPPALDAQTGLNFLQQYLLGENWYTVDPLPTAQVNVEVVHEILYKYSKKYRKEYKQRLKRRKKERGY